MLWIVLVLFYIWQYRVVSVFESSQEHSWDYRLIFIAFLLIQVLFLGNRLGRIIKLDVITLLWRLFMIGMGGITLILILIIVHNLTQSYTLETYLDAIFFFMGMYAWVFFFLSAVFLFRRFILYQRTRSKVQGWNLFLVLLGLSLWLTADPSLYEWNYLGYIISGFYVLLVLILSANVRWVAYLNFNQKLQALGLFALILIVSITYLIAATRFPQELEVPLNSLPGTSFFYYIFAFPVVYCSFSILVLFFNLPTSSVFELEGMEILSFSKINKAIRSNLDFSDISNSLLDMSILTSNAKAGWIEEINPETGEMRISLRKQISKKEIDAFMQGNDLTRQVLDSKKYILIRNTQKSKEFRNNPTRYRSLLCVPIISSKYIHGAVYVVNEVANSYEEVTINAVINYAEQAGIAFENAVLVKKAIELERYQEQLKIAQDVQDQLLPKQLPIHPSIQFVAENENAEEVGGDYYDVVEVNQDFFRVAIGDVSGKGTTAAFYMAEIKGIFHALSRLDLDIHTYLNTANKALSACMQRGSFVTLTYLEIDLKKRQIELIRAGHCPSLYYRAETDEICMFRDGTMGLGILRNDSFSSFIGPTQKIPIQSGDILLLFTDGIIEARNEAGEEYGYERLRNTFRTYRKSPAQDLANQIAESTKAFTHSALQDDYTVLVIRFP